MKKLGILVISLGLLASVAIGQSSPPASSISSGTYVRPNAEKRFKLYINDTVGPKAWIGRVAGAGFATATNSPEEWGGSWKGFGRRLASNVGKSVIKNAVAYSLDEAMKLDSHYYRSEKRDIGSRVKNALISPVTARKANGKRTIGVPKIVGTYASSVIASETWYPSRYSWKDGMRSGTISLGTTALFNVLKEFVFR